MSDKGSILLKVDNNVTYITGQLDSVVYKKLKKKLGYIPEDVYWMIETNKKKGKNKDGSYKRGQEWRKDWDGSISTVCWNKARCKCNIKKSHTHFPTGLIRKAINVFKEENVEIEFQDLRQKFDKTHNYTLSDKFERRDYQIQTIQKACSVDRGMIKCATGGGKSLIAIGIIARRGVSPAIFYVSSIDLLIQAKNEIEKFLLYNNKPVEVGMIGGGKKEIKDITVMTIQTAVRSLGGVWVKFDSEDKNEDETDIEDVKEEIVTLIRNAKLIIGDECLAGNTLIKTEKGDIRISDVSKLDCKYVLSHDGKKEIFKKIISFASRGERKVLKIRLNSGKTIRCTSDHLFMTKNGWIEAGNLYLENEVLVCKKHGNKNIKKLINLETILSIEDDNNSYVFDIGVEDTNCFFANGILVHNCQHWAAETCQIIADNSLSARYRIGQSATPMRDLNDDILIEGSFGRTIENITASMLIKKRYLVKPKILFITINNMRGIKRGIYLDIYRTAIVENLERNKIIATIAKGFRDEGRNILILCKQINHGKLLEKMIPGSIFLYGKHSGKKRKEHLDKMRKGEARLTISTVIFDEGIDVRSLDTLILAGSGKSSTRALQRVGRVLRSFPGKTGAIVVDFKDNCKYLLSHSRKREKIYRTEPEFDIIDIKDAHNT